MASIMDWDKEIYVNKSRKPHQCWECHRQIEQGTSYLRIVGVFNGAFYACKCHQTCRDAANHVMGTAGWEYYEDGWSGLYDELFCNWSKDEAEAVLSQAFPDVWERLKEYWDN